MSAGGILVTFASLESAAADTEQIARLIAQQLESLRSYLAPLTASWTGQAAGEYQVLQQRWDLSASDLQGVLVQIAQALRTAHANYQSAESRNRAIWG